MEFDDLFDAYITGISKALLVRPDFDGSSSAPPGIGRRGPGLNMAGGEVSTNVGDRSTGRLLLDEGDDANKYTYARCSS